MFMFKDSLLAIVLSGFLFTAAWLAAAQEAGTADPQSTPSTQQQEYGNRGHHGMDPAKRTQELTKRLSLTSEQQTKVQGILQTQQASMQNLRQDSSLSQQDRRAKMMDIRNTSDTQIRALLNEDQQQRWDSMESSRGQMRWRRQQGSQDSGANPQ
jgi:protein CpxP